ncbi:MAG: NusG domain II-containing protein [Turicibacter sp.]|nr:NusG domain II-containing protein [Turicibacter sp.]
MLKYRKMIRPFDMVVAVLLMAFSFAPIAVFAHQQAQIPDNAQIYAIVTIGREVVARFPLEEGGESFTVLYTHEDGLRGEQYNLVEVDGGRIRVKEDNSPDQIAVNTGWISRPGQTSICLPHQFMIRIETTNPVIDDDEIIIAG